MAKKPELHPWNRVEVAFHTGQVAVRDSKDPQGQMRRFNSIEWEAFLDGVRRGNFDLGSPR
jgi:hypothetical protein